MPTQAWAWHPTRHFKLDKALAGIINLSLMPSGIEGISIAKCGLGGRLMLWKEQAPLFPNVCGSWISTAPSVAFRQRVRYHLDILPNMFDKREPVG